MLNIAGAGDHIVSSSSIYGGTYNLFKYTLAKLGIETTFVEDQDDLEEWRRAVRPNTKLFFAETIGNPKINVLDITGVSDVAHESGVPLIVDNTIATPYLIRPFEHGADIVVHSATKFLGGHGTVIGGIIVDGGKFAWSQHAGQVPGVQHARPVVPRCGLRRGGRQRARLHREGARAAAARPRCVELGGHGVRAAAGHRDPVAPHRAPRVERAGDRRVARPHPDVATVAYAGLPTSPWYAAANRYAPKGVGAVLSFELKGGVPAGKAFVDNLQLFSHLANIGDVRSLVIHPASTTHSQLTPEQQLTTGVTPGLVRLSVGIENIEDLKADLEAGLAAARAVVAGGAARVAFARLGPRLPPTPNDKVDVARRRPCRLPPVQQLPARRCDFLDVVRRRCCRAHPRPGRPGHGADVT